jgi:hypothetical protein
LSLTNFVLHLPFAPARGVGLRDRRNEWNTHLLKVMENASPHCSIVNTGEEPIGVRLALFLTAALSGFRIRSESLASPAFRPSSPLEPVIRVDRIRETRSVHEHEVVRR